MLHAPRFLDAGDRALTVELGDAIDETTNAAVVALDRALAARAIAGIVETVPTYRSLLIVFRPELLSKADLQRAVMESWPPREAAEAAVRRWTIPVLYGGEAGEDLPFVARTHGLSEQAVIDLHTGADFRVFMLGFAPGFAYLGGLPERLHTSRRTDPRLRIPPGSISIGGKQAAVCPPLEIPSGWHLLGRTPVKTYDPEQPAPFLLGPGDRVRFRAISAPEFNELETAIAAGAAIAEMVQDA